MWAIEVVRVTQNFVNVRLVEVECLKNGVHIFTGRKTPEYAIDLVRYNPEHVAKRIALSLRLLVEEPMFDPEKEPLLLAAEIADSLTTMGLLVDGEVNLELARNEAGKISRDPGQSL